MYKRFRCGRLMLTKDGKLKKLDLENGGGSRLCDWHNKDMNFDEVHQLVLNIFKLTDNEVQTSLYDFQLSPLNINQYGTFFEYIHNNGLNCNSTVIYLCIHQTNYHNNRSRKNMKKKKNKFTIKTSISEQKISVPTTTSSTETSIEQIKIVKIEQDIDQQQIYNSSSEYSFINSIDDLMKNIHDLVSQNNFDEIFIQLFENLSMIHGYVCLIIDSLKQKIQESNKNFRLIQQSDITRYSNCLNNIYDICLSTKTLFKLNENKFSHIQHYSIITNSFIQFYENLKILHNQWFELVEINNKFYKNLSLSIHSIEQSTSTSSHLNIQSLSEDNFQIDTETINEESRENIILFEELLNYARDLLNVMYASRLSTFRTMMKSIIIEIESIKSNINIHNSESLLNAKNIVISLKTQYTNKFNSNAFTSSVYQITRPVKQAYQKTLKALCDLITSLTNYQTKAVENHRKSSNWSSTSLLITDQEQLENRQLIQSYKRKSDTLHADNHDQNEILSTTRTSLQQDIINDNSDIRELAEQIISKDCKTGMKNNPNIKRAKVLLIDEVEIFFSRDFYDNTYTSIASLRGPAITSLVHFI
ncbi:unnamed protein product [Rotaria sp. Silwood1]|nr:unnamed protein product [Rotaria sp. Silwood1]